MDCPNCKLVNPPTAARCDCGYDFQTHTIQRSYLTERGTDKILRWGAGGTGVELLIFLAMESAWRLGNEAGARHSLALAALLTLAVVASILGLWFWQPKNP